MAQMFPGQSRCAICKEPIATANEAIGFPAFIPKGHEFERFSDSVFHRACFDRWTDRYRFQRLFDEYNRIWQSRPTNLSFAEMEEWGKSAFNSLFGDGIDDVPK